MRRFGYFCLVVLAGLSVVGCGKDSGPDQTLNTPLSEWNLSTHQPGPNKASWSYESKGSDLLVISYTPLNASGEIAKEMKDAHEYMVSQVQAAPMLSRYWDASGYKVERQFAPVATTDLEHGTVNIMADSPTRVFSLVLTNPNMKQAELIKMGEAVMEEIVKANPTTAKKQK